MNIANCAQILWILCHGGVCLARDVDTIAQHLFTISKFPHLPAFPSKRASMRRFLCATPRLGLAPLRVPMRGLAGKGPASKELIDVDPVAASIKDTMDRFEKVAPQQPACVVVGWLVVCFCLRSHVQGPSTATQRHGDTQPAHTERGVVAAARARFFCSPTDAACVVVLLLSAIVVVLLCVWSHVCSTGRRL
jgi:hypothetical protein